MITLLHPTYKLFVFGHRSLTRNNTQNALINMAMKRIYNLPTLRCIVMFIIAVCALFHPTNLWTESAQEQWVISLLLDTLPGGPGACLCLASPVD